MAKFVFVTSIRSNNNNTHQSEEKFSAYRVVDYNSCHSDKKSNEKIAMGKRDGGGLCVECGNTTGIPWDVEYFSYTVHRVYLIRDVSHSFSS